METHLETNLPKQEKGEITLGGKTFKYKIIQRTYPAKWADLEITNDRRQSITIFFHPQKQNLQKEIRKVLQLYKWIK
jgi:hypothetical protein